MASFAQVMTAFHQQLLAIQSGVWVLPPRPSIRLHLGSASLAVARQISASIGPDAILLYLFPGSVEDEAYWREALSESERLRIIPLAFGPDTFVVDRVSMAATLLRYSTIGVSSAPALRAENAALLQALDVEINEGIHHRSISRSSWMSIAAAITGNIAVWRCREVLGLIDDAKDFPALVCGAGPSLSQSIPELQQYRDRLYIVSVGHAFKTLMENGIRPDMVVEIDANCSNNWTHEIDPGDIPLVASVAADPAVTARFRRVLWCATSQIDEAWNGWFSGLVEPLRLAIGRGVMITAIDLAYTAGFSRIALLGSDLCYSDEGHSHAGGEKDGDLKHHLIAIPGTDGGTVYSDGMFIGIRTSLEKYFSRPDRQNVTVYNCTIGGALIRGTTALSLAKFADSCNAIGPVVTVMPRSDATVWLEHTRGCLTDFLQLATVLNRSAGEGQDSSEADRQMAVEQLLGVEAMAKDTVAGIWIRNLKAQVDDWMDGAGIALERNEDSVAAVMFNLHWRNRTLRLLTESIMEKFTGALECCDTVSLRSFTRHIYRLSGFTTLFADWAVNTHPRLAEWLRQIHDPNPEWRLTMKWQSAPVVSRKVDHGWYALDPSLAQTRVPRKEMEAALPKINFCQESDGIVFLAPCGWRHVLGLVDLLPKTRLLVIEPWPELLQAIIGCSLFYHLLPEGSGIICADSRFPEWPELFRAQMEKWRQDGIVPKVLLQPRVDNFPEIVELAAQLNRLIADS